MLIYIKHETLNEILLGVCEQSDIDFYSPFLIFTEKMKKIVIEFIATKRYNMSVVSSLV